jgi:hypothetical protein
VRRLSPWRGAAGAPETHERRAAHGGGEEPDTRMVEKHYGHLAPSYIADAIRAGAPRFGFKPDPKLGRWEAESGDKRE